MAYPGKGFSGPPDPEDRPRLAIHEVDGIGDLEGTVLARRDSEDPVFYAESCCVSCVDWFMGSLRGMFPKSTLVPWESLDTVSEYREALESIGLDPDEILELQCTVSSDESGCSVTVVPTVLVPVIEDLEALMYASTLSNLMNNMYGSEESDVETSEEESPEEVFEQI